MESFNDWNPMEDAFHKRKHELKTGTLSEEVASSRKNDGYEVVVKGITPHCGDIQLRNLFSKCGTVTKCFVLKKSAGHNTHMAFIGYKTRVEAEKAIEEFDGFTFANYPLSVQVAMTKEEKEKRRQEQDLSGASPSLATNSQNKDERPVGMGRGRFSLNSECAENKSSGNLSDSNSITETNKMPNNSSLQNSINQNRSGNDSRRSGVRNSSAQSPISNQSSNFAFNQHNGSNSVSESNFSFKEKTSTNYASPSSKNPSISPERPPIKIGSVIEVFIIPEMYESPTCFPCQLKNPKYMKIHERYHNRQKSSSRREQFHPEDLVAAPFGNEYFRARILSRGQSDNDFLVTFIDYGNQARVSLSDIHRLDHDDAVIPSLLIYVAFDGADDSEDCAAKYIKRLEGMCNSENELKIKGLVVKHDETNDSYVINIDKQEPDPTSLNDSIVPIRPPENKFDHGQNVSFFVDLSTTDINNLSEVINCHTDDPLSTLVEMNSYYSTLSKEKSLDMSSMPIVKSYVAAPYENEYFRAKVIDIQRNMIDLYFIDYGNKETIDINRVDIFQLDEKFIEMPPLHVKCALDGFTRKNVDMIKKKLLAGCKDDRIILDGVVIEYDPDTKVCLLDIGLGKSEVNQNALSGNESQTPKLSASKATEVPQKIDIFNFQKYINVETIVTPNEAPTTNMCVVCPISVQEELSAFNDVVAKDAESSRRAQRVKRGDLVYAPFAGVFYRGMVKEIKENDKCRIYFIDYGNEDLVPLTELREFEVKSSAMKPAYCIPCRLSDIQCKSNESVFSEKSKTAFINLVTNSGTPISIFGLEVVDDQSFGSEILSVKISSESIPSFSDYLIDSGLVDRKVESPKLAPSPKVQKLQHSVPLQEKTWSYLRDLKKNTNLEPKKRMECMCLFNESPLDFTMISMTDVNSLTELSATLEKTYTEKSKCLDLNDLSSGMLVVARSEMYSSYYRGCVRRVHPNKSVDIYYIDFGNVETLGCNNLFPIEKEFLQDPPLGITCSLRGAPAKSYTPEIREQMESILNTSDNPQRKFKMMVLEVTTSDDPSMPDKAVVDVLFADGNRQPRNLLEELKLTKEIMKDSSQQDIKKSRTSNECASPTVSHSNQQVSHKSSINDFNKKQMNNQASTSGDCNCNQLQERVESLEESVIACKKKINELENVIFRFISQKSQ